MPILQMRSLSLRMLYHLSQAAQRASSNLRQSLALGTHKPKGER